MSTTARDASMRTEAAEARTEGPNERFTGYGVMGLPFASGHLLAFRRFPSTPFGRGYRSVWHRDPGGTWTFHVDAPAAESCPRYFDAAISRSVRSDIAITWHGPDRLTVEVAGVLVWRLELRASTPTALMTAMAGAMPEPVWESTAALAAMGRMAGAMLGAGRIRLAGRVPNGQWFKAGPRQVWSVGGSAVMHGVDLGEPAPLATQVRLGDFLLPQRGLFMVGSTSFEAFDPARHAAPRPAFTEVSR